MPTNKKEERHFVAEIRGAAEGRKISGHAAVFEKLSPVMGMFTRFREKISKGAFAESIKQNDVRALWSHNPDMVLGRTGNDSLRVHEDAEGLAFELDLPDTTLGRDTHELIKRGDVSGMSFGFRVLGEDWIMGKDGEPHTRTLTKIDLIEVSPTAFPAYDQTDVSARDMDAIAKEQEEKWAAAIRAAELAEGKTVTVQDVRAQLFRLELISKIG